LLDSFGGFAWWIDRLVESIFQWNRLLGGLIAWWNQSFSGIDCLVESIALTKLCASHKYFEDTYFYSVKICCVHPASINHYLLNHHECSFYINTNGTVGKFSNDKNCHICKQDNIISYIIRRTASVSAHHTINHYLLNHHKCSFYINMGL